MKKSAGIAVGVIVVLGALGTAGAWYTGKQLPSVLEASIKQANEEMAKALPAVGINVSIELLSLDREFFSSNARYRIKFSGPQDGELPSNLEWVVNDRIEHGPFPLSRLKAFKLMPVMASSNYALEQSPELEKWFAATNGVSPLNGQVSLGYDRSVSGTLELEPLQLPLDESTHLGFSGLTLDIDSSADGRAVSGRGQMASLKVTSSRSDAPMSIEFKDLSLDSDLNKGSSEFYLGSNEVRLKTIALSFGSDNKPLLLKDVVQRDETSENGDLLAARYSYDVGMISYDGRDIGSSQMVWSLKNLDSKALQSMIALYGDLMQADWQYQKTSSATGMPELSAEQEAKLKADLQQLLAGKPGLALEKLAFKTANGESSLKLALDIGNPASLDLPAPELAKQLVSQFDAKLVVSKPMIGDVVSAQAAISGQTDQEAIAGQAQMMTEMASGMLLATELATLQGDDIVSSLHYVNDQVDFNGKKMTVEEFVGMALAMGGGLGGGLGAPALDDEAPALDEQLPEEDEASAGDAEQQ